MLWEAVVSTFFLTENEVSERTKISLGTLRRWRLENRGPTFRKFGSLVRYSEDDLTAWQNGQPGGGGGKPGLPQRPLRSRIAFEKAG
jgi:hypothetical protein